MQFFFIFWPHPPRRLAASGVGSCGAVGPSKSFAFSGQAPLFGGASPTTPCGAHAPIPNVTPETPTDPYYLRSIFYGTLIFRIKRIRFRILARW